MLFPFLVLIFRRGLLIIGKKGQQSADLFDIALSVLHNYGPVTANVPSESRCFKFACLSVCELSLALLTRDFFDNHWEYSLYVTPIIYLFLNVEINSWI